MEISSIILHIESLIFASDRPLTSLEITDLINQAFGFMEDKISPEQIDAAMNGIIEKYSSEFYPFEVRQSGGGWQFLTKKEFHKTVAQLNGEKFLKRLSAAALETLAIIAYKHPITKGEIEAIRGVSSDYSIQKLLEKELIVITGRNEKLPGHPLVYATSKNFMDYFGINSVEDLPRIKEVLSEQVIPTPAPPEVEESENLSVSTQGELIDRNTDDEEPSALNGHSFPFNNDTEGEGPAADEESRLFIDDAFDAEASGSEENELNVDQEEISEESDDIATPDFDITEADETSGDQSDDVLEEIDLNSFDQEEDEENEDDEESDGEDDYNEVDEDEDDPDDLAGLEEEENELLEDDDAEDEDGDFEEDEDDDDEDDEENGKDGQAPRKH